MDNAEKDRGKGRERTKNVKKIGTQERMVKLGRNGRQKVKRGPLCCLWWCCVDAKSYARCGLLIR